MFDTIVVVVLVVLACVALAQGHSIKVLRAEVERNENRRARDDKWHAQRWSESALAIGRLDASLFSVREALRRKQDAPLLRRKGDRKPKP